MQNFCVPHALLFTDGRMKDLGTFGCFESYATGINNSGQDGKLKQSDAAKANGRWFLQNQRYDVFVRPLLLPLVSQQAIDRQPLPLPPALQNAYVKSVTLRNQDVLNEGLRVSSPPSEQLVITIGTNAGSLEGRVRNGQQPSPATTGVAPGAYKLFAWESIEPFAWQNADFMRDYELQGKLVQVGEGAKMVDLELNAIP